MSICDQILEISPNAMHETIRTVQITILPLIIRQLSCTPAEIFHRIYCNSIKVAIHTDL